MSDRTAVRLSELGAADQGPKIEAVDAATSETMAEATVVALRKPLERRKHSRPVTRKPSDLFQHARKRLAKLPVLDKRTPDEILGYDETGLPL